MQKFIEVGIILLLGLGLCLGIYWLLWHLWLWVLPQVWPTGPAQLINPNFWLFSACWLLAVFVGRAIFGGAKSK